MPNFRCFPKFSGCVSWYRATTPGLQLRYPQHLGQDNKEGRGYPLIGTWSGALRRRGCPCRRAPFATTPGRHMSPKVKMLMSYTSVVRSMNYACRTYECIDTRVNGSCRTSEYVMSHVWMHPAAHWIGLSCGAPGATCRWGVSSCSYESMKRLYVLIWINHMNMWISFEGLAFWV